MITRARRTVERWRRRAQTLRDDLTSPLPRVQLAHRRSVPAWSVRLLLIGFGVVTIVVLHPGAPPVLLLSGFLVGVAIQPGPLSGCLYCLALAVIWLVLTTPPVSLATVLLIGFGPAIPALAAVIERLPLRTRIELGVLLPPLTRYAVVQAITQPIVLAAGSLSELRLGLLPIAVVAVAVVAAAAWWLLPRLSD